MIEISEEAVRDKIISSFKKLGLSTHESIAYTTLLSLSRAPASTLCKRSRIPDSKIYYALDGLSKRGMIVVQRGTPNLYKALHPKEAITNLKRQLTKNFDEKMKEADRLIDMLSPTYESAEGSGELELAYIVRGLKNIINKMNALIKSSRKEATVFIHSPVVLQGIKGSLMEAKERHIKLNIAVTEKAWKTEVLTGFENVKLLRCQCSMIISDMRTLLIVSDLTTGGAIMTQDQNLMRICKESYENPKCCTKIE